MVSASAFVDMSNPATTYVGVTEINGDLELNTLVDVSSFDCLEIVDGELDIQGGAEGENLLGGFPNLRQVGGSINYTRFNGSTVDFCSFRSLEVLGFSTHAGAFDAVGSDVGGDLSRKASTSSRASSVSPARSRGEWSRRRRAGSRARCRFHTPPFGR